MKKVESRESKYKGFQNLQNYENNSWSNVSLPGAHCPLCHYPMPVGR